MNTVYVAVVDNEVFVFDHKDSLSCFISKIQSFGGPEISISTSTKIFSDSNSALLEYERCKYLAEMHREYSKSMKGYF